jgi:hypothetical protein
MAEGEAAAPEVKLDGKRTRKNPLPAGKFGAPEEGPKRPHPAPSAQELQERLKEMGTVRGVAPSKEDGVKAPLAAFDFGIKPVFVPAAPPAPHPGIAAVAFEEGVMTGMLIGAGAVIVGFGIYWLFSGSTSSLASEIGEFDLPLKKTGTRAAARAAKAVVQG